jgi:hypothetical protein
MSVMVIVETSGIILVAIVMSITIVVIVMIAVQMVQLTYLLNYIIFVCFSDEIREYFGETISMYFGFLGFYSLTLVPPVLLMVVFWLSNAHEQTKNTVFAVLNLLWATVFLEAWKRRCAELSFKWGTLKGGLGTYSKVVQNRARRRSDAHIFPFFFREQRTSYRTFSFLSECLIAAET